MQEEAFIIHTSKVKNDIITILYKLQEKPVLLRIATIFVFGYCWIITLSITTVIKMIQIYVLKSYPINKEVSSLVTVLKIMSVNE